MKGGRISGVWGITALMIMLCVSLSSPALSDNSGKSEAGRYSELTALWWQWVFAQPAADIGGTNSNPVLDSTGDFADSGQEDGIGPGGNYFFLAGTFGGDATRTITIPAGKTLFFPIFNFEA